MNIESFIQTVVQKNCTAYVEPLPQSLFQEGGSQERSFKITIKNPTLSTAASFIIRDHELMSSINLEYYLNDALNSVCFKNRPPKPPLSRIVREGTIGDCPNCKSTTIKRFVFFGKPIGCINKLCTNYYK